MKLLLPLTLLTNAAAFSTIGPHIHKPHVQVAIGHPTAPRSHDAIHLPASWNDKHSEAASRQSWTVTESSSTCLSMSSNSGDGPLLNPFISGSLLIALDVMFRKLLKAAAISFPSSLAGCGVMFATMLLAPFGNGMFQILTPGAALLAKWLPVFFVPSLITLPLANGFGSAAEGLKVAAVIVIGFLFTMLTTAGSVVGIRKLLGTAATADPVAAAAAVVESVPSKPAPKPFSDELAKSLLTFQVVSGACAILATKSKYAYANPITTLFLLSSTLSNFVTGARMPKSFSKIVHPLVTCTTLTWGVLTAFGAITGSTFRTLLRSYKKGTMCPFSSGAGDLLLFLLGPAVVSLAVSMYDRRKLMKENIAEVGTAVGVSSFGGLFGTAAAVRLLSIASPSLRLSLLSRNITSPLAMAIAGILGADVSLAVSMVVVTGLIGANFGASLMDAFRINDAVARGLGMGAAAHGLGTAAIVNEKDAFPFSAISMALTASACTVLVSIPIIKRLVIQLALGA